MVQIYRTVTVNKIDFRGSSTSRIVYVSSFLNAGKCQHSNTHCCESIKYDALIERFNLKIESKTQPKPSQTNTHSLTNSLTHSSLVLSSWLKSLWRLINDHWMRSTTQTLSNSIPGTQPILSRCRTDSVTYLTIFILHFAFTFTFFFFSDSIQFNYSSCGTFFSSHSIHPGPHTFFLPLLRLRYLYFSFMILHPLQTSPLHTTSHITPHAHSNN